MLKQRNSLNARLDPSYTLPAGVEASGDKEQVGGVLPSHHRTQGLSKMVVLIN